MFRDSGSNGYVLDVFQTSGAPLTQTVNGSMTEDFSLNFRIIPSRSKSQNPSPILRLFEMDQERYVYLFCTEIHMSICKVSSWNC